MTFGRLSRAIAADPEGRAADVMTITENGYPTLKGTGYHFGKSQAQARDGAGPGELVAAVDVALELGRPLLVSGEPGCGKTELGYAIARRLGIERLYLYSVKSSSDASELFYTYDALQRFRDAQLSQAQALQRLLETRLGQDQLPADGPEPDQRDVGDYIEFQALGRAIIDAHPLNAIYDLLRGKHALETREEGRKPRPSVVIIDEIDKAPRDFPNDLLHEIETMSFRVREFPGRTPPGTPPGSEIARENWPIVIVTSNEERQLPDAFLRRCIFHEIAFPERDALKQIIASGLRPRLARMGWRGASKPGSEPTLTSEQTRKLIDFLTDFRNRDPDKKPGIAEMLDAAALLFVSGASDLSIVIPAIAKLRRDAKLAGDIVPP